jgi:hypothetical protein
MEHRHSLIPASGGTAVLATALLAVAATAARAQTWETLMALDHDDGYVVMIDPFSDPLLPGSPGLFLGGSSSLGAVLHLDQSTTPDTLLPSDPTASVVERLGTDALGNLYSAGSITVGSQSSWQVRKSQDAGATWTTVDNASTWAPKGDSTALGVTADASGNIYVCGQAYLSSTARSPYWVIRKGANYGQNWTKVYTSTKNIAIGAGVQFVPAVPGKHAGGVFAAGRQTPGGVTQWTVLRSRNLGLSWETVDAWAPGKNSSAVATGVTSDSQGNLFVIGYDGSSTPGWYVRKSSDGGSSWQTILNKYAQSSMSLTFPRDLATDGGGNLYVVGNTGGLSGSSTWTVRRWDAGTQAWDEWPAALRFLGSGYAARGIAIDAAGSAYVTGRMTGSIGMQWVLQKLATN